MSDSSAAVKSNELDEATRIQRDYYAATAASYDTMHGREGGDDPRIMKVVSGLLNMAQARTILDVGAGTGLGVSRLSRALPGSYVCGVEPVAALIEEGVKRDSALSGSIIQGVGESLPFADKEFDAVCSFALLHHVRRPNLVIKEMMRVARKIVIISDSNRFGQGRKASRWLKLFLYKTRLWPVVNYVKTGGKGYLITAGDGLAYSYSVYDSLEDIANWAEELFIVPATPCKADSWLHPLLTATHAVICGIKESVPEPDAIRRIGSPNSGAMKLE